MAAPSAGEILELYDELNFPSAAKLRAALLKKGYRVRMKDVEEFVKAQTPHTALCQRPALPRSHHQLQGQRALGVGFHRFSGRARR